MPASAARSNPDKRGMASNWRSSASSQNMTRRRGQAIRNFGRKNRARNSGYFTILRLAAAPVKSPN
jgi:hypothetical protein